MWGELGRDNDALLWSKKKGDGSKLEQLTKDYTYRLPERSWDQNHSSVWGHSDSWESAFRDPHSQRLQQPGKRRG
jgi:hypothetical protein